MKHLAKLLLVLACIWGVGWALLILVLDIYLCGVWTGLQKASFFTLSPMGLEYIIAPALFLYGLSVIAKKISGHVEEETS